MDDIKMAKSSFFCFLLALTMVNVQNAGCYFAKLPKIDAIRAHKLIAQQLILNKYIQNAAQFHRKRRSTDRKLVILPTFQKFKFHNGPMQRQISEVELLL